VELLTRVTPYESGWSDNYLAAYLLGEAYLEQHRGRDAAAEFRKIIDHRGVVLSSPIGALAHLNLGRAYALEGDAAKARGVYGDFLALWKDADADVPILIAAQSEFDKLR
jgi:TolA-binding protein